MLFLEWPSPYVFCLCHKAACKLAFLLLSKNGPQMPWKNNSRRSGLLMVSKHFSLCACCIFLVKLTKAYSSGANHRRGELMSVSHGSPAMNSCLKRCQSQTSNQAEDRRRQVSSSFHSSSGCFTVNVRPLYVRHFYRFRTQIWYWQAKMLNWDPSAINMTILSLWAWLHDNI